MILRPPSLGLGGGTESCTDRRKESSLSSQFFTDSFKEISPLVSAEGWSFGINRLSVGGVLPVLHPVTLCASRAAELPDYFELVLLFSVLLWWMSMRQSPPLRLCISLDSFYISIRLDLTDHTASSSTKQAIRA